jgi:hypothetical protein
MRSVLYFLLTTVLDKPPYTSWPVSDCQKGPSSQQLVLYGHRIPRVQGLPKEVCILVPACAKTTRYGKTQSFPSTLDLQVLLQHLKIRNDAVVLKVKHDH